MVFEDGDFLYQAPYQLLIKGKNVVRLLTVCNVLNRRTKKNSEIRGATNYIGVTAEQRGKGYVNELLWEGSQLLIDEGIKSLIT